MLYGDEVMRLRREIVSLKKQLGEEVTNNDDLFLPRDVGAKEFEQLQREQASLMRRQEADEKRQDLRNRALRELEQDQDSENQRRPVKPILGAAGKPRRDNRDLFVSEEEFRRTGGK